MWIVGPLSQMETIGLWMSHSPYVSLPAETPYRQLADAVRVALSQSGTIPDINFRDTPVPPSPVLEAAGVKSWSTFHKGAKLISLSADSERITLTPNRNEGPREGFNPMAAAELSIPATATDDELGAAIERAFADCR